MHKFKPVSTNTLNRFNYPLLGQIKSRNHITAKEKEDERFGLEIMFECD